MIKIIIKILSTVTIILALIVFYLSFFGVNTVKFNENIKTKIQSISKNVNIELNTVKLLLNIKNLSINVKTFGPKIVIDNKRLELENITTNISIKSFLKDDFSIDDLKISTKIINLKDVILLARSVKNSPQLFLLDSMIEKGILVADIDLNFDTNGKIKNDYQIKGFIKKAKLDILNRHSIDNLNFIFNITDENFDLKDIETNFNKIDLSLPFIKIIEKKNKFLVNGRLISKSNNTDINTLNNILAGILKNFKIKEVDFSSDSDFTFTFNKKFKITNFNLSSTIDLNKLLYKNDSLKLKKYLPSYKDSIEIKNHLISINYQKDRIEVIGVGKIKIQNHEDDIDYKVLKNKDQYIFDTNIKFNNNPLFIKILQYTKKEDTDSVLKINGTYKKNEYIKFNSVSFTENDNKFLVKKLNFDNKFDFLSIKKLELDYINQNKLKNQIKLIKNKKDYLISGKSIDISKIISKSLNSDDKEKSSIFKNLNTVLNIEIKKAYLDNDVFVNDLVAKLHYQDNEIKKINLDSTFLNKKKLTLTINTNDNNEKITTFFTGYPKPLVKEYKFIKGFEEGILDFYSIKKDGISNSLLTIDNFKIKEVPAFAKLLSLASLQGIADLLTGEGIRFSDFEMKFSNERELMTIEELYAIGPAVSILMDGYIEKKKLISLRGTLVPATTINRSIASIPLIGGILVGKKVGEGVFGVSFKIKGPPKNLKTSVNPVKTLTPRFITRTLEKIKKD
ncbi:hypothetical protein N9S39_00545 [Candidatus Pelagibacter sp.]|nr:hypothetical protein [Candidatus Pelagibacter sp.]